jgi:integrase
VQSRLTDLAINSAKPGRHDRLLADGRNLYLRIRPSGSKGWIVRIKRNGARRVHSVGAWPAVSLADARAQAARLVSVERGDARALVKEAVKDFMAARIEPRYRRLNNAQVYATAIGAALGRLSVDAVRPRDVSRMVLDYKRRGPVAAMRLLSFAKMFFNWCTSLGYIDVSPVQSIKAASFGVDESARERVLSDDEIRAFWNAEDLPHRALLRFLLLTGLRIGEAQVSVIEWIDNDGWLNLPAVAMKKGKAHRAFLSPLARAQIEGAARPDLFRSVSPTAVQAALRRWHIRHGAADGTRWSPHDLRRTFATRCGDVGVAPHVIAKCIAHAVAGSGSLPVYLRSEWLDERRAATLALGDHVAGIVS